VDRFARRTEFKSLTVQDLLEARDRYHVHIANLPHVVGTAVGRYRIRKDDDNASDPRLSHRPPGAGAPPRTLENSVIRDWSWPAVLVFVDTWVGLDTLSRHPEAIVPPRLYLPDGRVVPTCVVLASRRQADLSAGAGLSFPTGLVGGGYPIFRDAQGTTLRGTIGGIVSDGAYSYALTSSHVAGDAGERLYTYDRGGKRQLGTAEGRMAGKYPLSDLYPGFAGVQTLVTLDAGLVLIDDIQSWTCQVLGVGRIGAPLDINANTLSLDIIGCPVFARAAGADKGGARGEIQGLFFRYATLGGTDHVAELLIGPRAGAASVDTRPGDSGSLWFWDEAADALALGDGKAGEEGPGAEDGQGGNARTRAYRPVGIQWGGQGFFGAGAQPVEFALASTLSAVCRQLDVEIVRDWNVGHSQYWGKVGHYKIGYAACFMAGAPELATLLAANAQRISVSDEDVSAGNLPGASDRTAFVALADVPDLVWRYTRKMDEANHFADMDQPGEGEFAGQTLLALWAADKTSRTAQAWTRFYDALAPSPADKHRGALPFRVRQLYEAMVGFAGDGDVAGYVCAAGVLAHYIGDGCQPLHVSELHHGHPGHPEEEKVHSVYETAMLDANAPDLVARMARQARGKRVKKRFTGGDAAADAVVQLMRRTIAALPPETVVDCYLRNKGRGQLDAMWAELGEATIARMVDGALTLATVWESAWEEGGGGKIAKSRLKAVPKDTLMRLYNDRGFVESRWLKDM